MTAWDWAVVVAVAALLITASSYRGRDTRRFRAHQQEYRTNQLWRVPPPLIETEPGNPHSDDRITAELIYIPRQRTEEDR